MADYFIHEDDTYIDRDSSESTACLRDSEDGSALCFFGKSWSDEAIYLALKFANSTYAEGVKYGEARKAKEIRDALKIDN